MQYTSDAKRPIEVFDSTLRDGAQGEGIAFSIEDKLKIVAALDDLGVAYIEAGNPGSNPKDMEFFERAAGLGLRAKLVAFGSTCRKNTPPQEDSNLRAVLSAGTQTVCIFGKSWAFQATEILGISRVENLSLIEESCRYLKSAGKEVIFDCEHFFDGYRDDPAYALESAAAALRGGANAICLCDTRGGSLPAEVGEITAAVCAAFPGTRVAIHPHNDIGCAVACAIEAVQAGATQVQGTYLGFGERCGNAALSSIIPALQLKLPYRLIPEEKLSALTATANRIAEISNTSIKRNEPFVGRSAFAHKAGMHADGVLKNPKSFEHMDPETVGNRRRVLMSEMTGRTAAYSKIRAILPGLTRESEEVAAVITELKRREQQGYQYEGADASFEMLVRRVLGLFESSFSLVSYKIMDELPYDEACSATATIKVRVGGRMQISAAEGDGPVNALDKALREALSVFYPVLDRIRLIDYKVRVMEPKDATAATVRVLITSTDGEELWSTVGVSSDLIEASWFALVDSIEYKLRDTHTPAR
ncbi:MAG: citramalate synthase [Candidatus Howiella sp.]